MSEARHIASAVARLGDRHANADPMTVFFSEAARLAVAGRAPDDALRILAGMIEDATFAKLRGEGPPLDEVNAARRLWLEIYNATYARTAA